MVIEIVRNRMVVGSRKGEWSKVYLEPILETDDLTTPDLAPELALYSRSYGTATENEPMLGEVAWEPLLNPEYFGSSVKQSGSCCSGRLSGMRGDTWWRRIRRTLLSLKSSFRAATDKERFSRSWTRHAKRERTVSDRRNSEGPERRSF